MSPNSVSIPYGAEQITFDVPDSHPLAVLTPNFDRATASLSPYQNLEVEIRRALAEPIGAPSLGQFVRATLDSLPPASDRPASRRPPQVVILVDDLTRPTPQQAILPILLDQLNHAGVPDRQVTVLIALGTHRPMTPAEIRQRFGEQVTQRVQVLNNPWQDSTQMVDLGATPNGTPVQVSRLALKAGFLLGAGSIVPHHIPGFSGGAKIVQPGITGAATTGATHLLSTRTRRSYLGLVENPVRAEMEWIAERVGLKAIFNTVLAPDGSLVQAFYGEPRQAFRQGAALAARVWGAKAPFQPDIVVAGSHPCDIEFWQAHKSLYPADMLLKDGGTLILVTPCPEGVSVMHPEVLDYAGLPPEEILARIQNGAIADVAAGALALAWAQVRQRLHIRLVSHGIPPAAARALG
ncbi:MAG TPA: nickel-dependent lactate racemase, partial [Polyangia bacterium]